MEADRPLSEVGETQSAVAWGAVLAGAAATVAASFVLVALVGGLGLLLPTPWPGRLGDISRYDPMLGALMIAIQVLSSALGGYLAGRLRTRWTHIHDHEMHFRDTAHGLLAWAVSLLAGIILASSLVAPVANRAALVAAATVEASAAASAPGSVPALDAAAAQRRLEREANLAAQASLFMGVGLLLGAFSAAVAAAIGGLRTEEMHTAYWSRRAGA